jgi:uncharacterized protein YegP (UPF0339 family)
MDGIIVELAKGKGIQPWFLRLKNWKNGQTLAVSEGYVSRWNAKRAARKNFPGVELVDTTVKPYRSFGAGK